jgi:hypothetical protein
LKPHEVQRHRSGRCAAAELWRFGCVYINPRAIVCSRPASSREALNETGPCNDSAAGPRPAALDGRLSCARRRRASAIPRAAAARARRRPR